MGELWNVYNQQYIYIVQLQQLVEGLNHQTCWKNGGINHQTCWRRGVKASDTKRYQSDTKGNLVVNMCESPCEPIGMGFLEVSDEQPRQGDVHFGDMKFMNPNQTVGVFKGIPPLTLKMWYLWIFVELRVGSWWKNQCGFFQPILMRDVSCFLPDPGNKSITQNSRS